MLVLLVYIFVVFDQMPEGSNPAHPILDGLYELHDTVGTGGFAKVKLATHILTGMKVKGCKETR